MSLLFPSKLAPCLDALYQACWIDGITNIGEPEVFILVLQRVFSGNEMSKKSRRLRMHLKPESCSLLILT